MGRQAVKITADTNILIRAIVADDPEQARLAQNVLQTAELVAVPIVALCEMVWVLARGYRIASPDIGAALRQLLSSANVAVDRPAAEAGLAALFRGGDFADGVIAHEGRMLGGDIFVSFDKQAVALAGGRVPT